MDSSRNKLVIAARSLVALVFACVTPAAARQAGAEHVSVLVNGRLWTGDGAAPWAEAVAVRGGKILPVGSEEEVLAAAGADFDRQDLNGAFVTPGFIDGHTRKLAPGYMADPAVLSQNLFEIDSDDIKDVNVLRTMVDGRWVYIASTLTP